jgi:nitroreductase
MKFQVEKEFWETAVNSRHSCRSYKDIPVEANKIQNLREFAESLECPFEHETEIRLFKTRGRKITANLKNPPPDCVAFLSKTGACDIAKTGFVGELFLLYATGLGIKTCWYGHYILSEVELCMPHLGVHKNDPMPMHGFGKGAVEGIRAICISPLGYHEKQGLRLTDRLVSSMMSFKRKPLSELIENGRDPETLPAKIRYALELAVKAPSAANTQHWRFTVADDDKTISIACQKGFRHFKWEHYDTDIGICAAHFWIGMKTQGINCKVELLPNQDKTHITWRFTPQ